MNLRRCLGTAACVSLVALLAAAKECQAEWGRYRAVTSYSVPSTPVYTPAVPVQSVFRPVIVAPEMAAPVISAPIAVTPPIIYSPQTTYYAPVPAATYYAPVTAYYAPPVTVQPVVMARPAFVPRARNVYSFTPARAAAIPVVVP